MWTTLKSDLALYRIHYDVWFRESTLHEGGAVKAALDRLTELGMTYEQEGALWYKNAEVQRKRLKAAGKTDEEIEALGLKDDVLVRANGHPTYFAADIAYITISLRCAASTASSTCGARITMGMWRASRARWTPSASTGTSVDIVLMQLVRLMKDGQPYKMSKRSGKAVSLTDLMRRSRSMRRASSSTSPSPNATLDFDLDLAVKNSSRQRPGLLYCSTRTRPHLRQHRP